MNMHKATRSGSVGCMPACQAVPAAVSCSHALQRGGAGSGQCGVCHQALAGVPGAAALCTVRCVATHLSNSSQAPHSLSAHVVVLMGVSFPTMPHVVVQSLWCILNIVGLFSLISTHPLRWPGGTVLWMQRLGRLGWPGGTVLWMQRCRRVVLRRPTRWRTPPTPATSVWKSPRSPWSRSAATSTAGPACSGVFMGHASRGWAGSAATRPREPTRPLTRPRRARPAPLLLRCRWMQLQNYTRACPVCKAGVEVDKVRCLGAGRGQQRLALSAHVQVGRWAVRSRTPTHPPQTSVACARACTHHTQVIPIYGRGSDFDPRQEAIKVQPVPPRPAGQRPSAVQPAAAGSNQQGVLPALFGFQLGPGEAYTRERRACLQPGCGGGGAGNMRRGRLASRQLRHFQHTAHAHTPSSTIANTAACAAPCCRGLLCCRPRLRGGADARAAAPGERPASGRAVLLRRYMCCGSAVAVAAALAKQRMSHVHTGR
jgi:hypothetical protein